MKLLTFAHRGEALAFLSLEKSGEQFTAVDFIFSGLLKSQKYFLLITGEGAQIATEKTIATLTQFGSEINEVLNLGVAGSLTQNLKKNDLVWIRSSYAHHAEKLEFKSYTTDSPQAAHDCMSAFARVLSVEEKIKISHFADVVDRELWAIASAAHLFKKPFRSLKIISDEMKHEGEDICRFVKEEAPLYSEKLLNEFLKESGHSSIAIDPIEPSEFLSDRIFYFTVSQERKLQSTLEGLRLLGLSERDLMKDPFISSLKDMDLLPKERTRQLIEYLGEKLNPVSKKIREYIEDTLKPLKEARIQVTYDNDFEENWLNLNVRIHSTRDLERLKNALKIFSFEDFKKIFDGEFDV